MGYFFGGLFIEDCVYDALAVMIGAFGEWNGFFLFCGGGSHEIS